MARDTPEFSAYWTPPVTNFDAEDAPAQIGRVFDSVTVYPWVASHGRHRPTVAAASRGLPAPLRVTKRGALILATRSQPDTAAVPGRGDVRRAALRSLPPAEVDRDAIGALMAGRTPTQEDSP